MLKQKVVLISTNVSSQFERLSGDLCHFFALILARQLEFSLKTVHEQVVVINETSDKCQELNVLLEQLDQDLAAYLEEFKLPAKKMVFMNRLSSPIEEMLSSTRTNFTHYMIKILEATRLSTFNKPSSLPISPTLLDESLEAEEPEAKRRKLTNKDLILEALNHHDQPIKSNALFKLVEDLHPYHTFTTHLKLVRKENFSHKSLSTTLSALVREKKILHDGGDSKNRLYHLEKAF